MVSEIRPRMNAILQLYYLLRRYRQRLQQRGVEVTTASMKSLTPPDGDEATGRIHKQAVALYDCIRSEIEQVHHLGAIVKDIELGLVDFPSLRNGHEPVLLCWQLGERQITHYHSEREGMAGRQSIHGSTFSNNLQSDLVKLVEP